MWLCWMKKKLKLNPLKKVSLSEFLQKIRILGEQEKIEEVRGRQKLVWRLKIEKNNPQINKKIFRQL